jgi:hypothetical protein
MTGLGVDGSSRRGGGDGFLARAPRRSADVRAGSDSTLKACVPKGVPNRRAAPRSTAAAAPAADLRASRPSRRRTAELDSLDVVSQCHSSDASDVRCCGRGDRPRARFGMSPSGASTNPTAVVSSRSGSARASSRRVASLSASCSSPPSSARRRARPQGPVPVALPARRGRQVPGWRVSQRLAGERGGVGVPAIGPWAHPCCDRQRCSRRPLARCMRAVVQVCSSSIARERGVAGHDHE